MDGKTIILSSLLIIRQLLWPISVWASISLPQIPTTGIVPDGVLTEWPADSFQLFSNNQSSQTSRWAAVYDDFFLHLAIEVIDDTLEFSDFSSQTFLGNDAIRIYLGETGRECALIITYQQQLGRTCVVADFFPESQTPTDPRWCIAAIRETPQGYTCELSIARWRIPGLETGKTFKLQIVVLDFAAKILRQVHTLNGETTNWFDTDQFLLFSLPF